MAFQQFSADQRFTPQHPPASHDEFLARRHVERAPRDSSLTTKLTSSFDLPADRDSVQQFSCELRFMAQHPPTSHDEFLARRHFERAPRVSWLETKLTSPFDLPEDRDSADAVLCPRDDTMSGPSSGAPPTPPSASPASDMRPTRQTSAGGCASG